MVINSKYGTYSSTQLNSVKLSLRRAIFFLLLYVDPDTNSRYSGVDVVEAFHNVQYKLNGLNSLLLEPPELVTTMSLIEAALQEYKSECFDFAKYRKLILDAGAEIMRGGDHDVN